MAASCDYKLDIDNLTHEETDVLVYFPNEWIIYEVLLPSLFAFGLLTNLSFIFVVYRSPQLRTQTYAYLVNLSIFDLMFVISNTSRRIIQYTSSPLRNDNYFAGLTGCVIFRYIDGMCYAGSSVFVTLVSIERYLAICYPIYHHLVKGEKRMVKLICAGWISALTMGVWIVFLRTDTNITCIAWPADQKYDKYPVTLVSCVPLSFAVADFIYASLFLLWVWLPLFNATMYYKIMKAVNERNIKSIQPCASDAQSAQSRQVVIMLVANGTIFYSCCMVIEVMLLILFLRKNGLLVSDELTNIIWDHIFGLIFTLNCCINPIVYSLINNRYRQIFFGVMKSLIYKTSNNSNPQINDTRR